MTRKIPVLLTIIATFLKVSGQDFPTYLKENALKVDKLDSLSKAVYDLLSDYRLIMIGEMHGTNEPARLVTGLVDLFTRSGDSVQVGFEIQPEQMTAFLKQHSDSSIFQSGFFAKPSVDGRASVAWANAIAKANKNPKASVFFYDVNGDYSSARDSLMYLNIKAKLNEHPKWKTITLSGNIHNMLLPYKGQNKTASFLYNDTSLDIADKICSLNHQYQSGTMLNNIGKGLQLRETGQIDSEYSQLPYEMYLFLFPINYKATYSGIYFTRQVTAAELVTK